MVQSRQNIDQTQAELMTWLAKQIFTAYPEDVSGLRFYFLDCFCIYYQRLSRDGELDKQYEIYREPSDGPCDICMRQEGVWRDRVVDEMVVYNSRFQIW
jgi:hypothetical protein